MQSKAGKRAKRLLSLLLALVMCIGMLPGVAMAADVSYTQVTSADQFTTGQYYMVTDTGYAPGVLDGTWVSAVEKANAAQDAVWTLTVTDNTVIMQDGNGAFIAPKGGKTNGIQQGEYDWTWAFNEDNGTFTFSGQGEDTVILASNKGSDNKFRAYKNTTVSSNPAGYPSEFTLYKAEGGSEPGGDVTVAAPQASPQAGEVTSGTEITLSTTTTGASIYYTMDDTVTNIATEGTLYSDSSKPVITKDCTLRAVAVLGDAQSAVQELSYTIEEETAPIADGDQVVIYAPAYNKALSANYNGYYNKGTDVTIGADGTLSGYTAADIWTVVKNDDGTWSFSHNDKNIGMGDSYTSMPLGEKNDKWELVAAGDGFWYVKNTVRDAYMEWHASKNNWSAYNIASGSEDMFELKFYQVAGTEPAPDIDAPFEAGNSVVIYAPSNNMALSATVKNSYYPVGVEVTVSGDTLTGYGNTEIWTVGGDANGWTFTSNGGKTLSMAGSYSSMYPGAGANETWVLEAAETEGQYYVKNAGRSAYMFWDNEYDDWTTKSDQKTAVAFCMVEPLEEEPEVEGLEVRATPSSGASVEAGDTIELTAAEGATIYYTTDGTEPTKASAQYTGPLTLGDGEGRIPAPTGGDEELVIKAIAVIPAAAGTEEQTGAVCTFTYKAPMTLDGYQLYFGQLHSHTNISDGAGTVEEAFTHASNVDNLDFLAVTDHSNSFDNESDSRVDLGVDLTGVSSEWKEGHEAAAAVTDDDFVGL